MARTDAQAVALVIDTDLEPGQIDAFIADANLWVTATLADSGLETDTLAAIEKYLACHLITLRDPRLTQSRVGDVGESYQRDGSVTEYLRAAVGLDPTGAVADAFDPAGRPRAKWRVGAGYASRGGP